ncbi:MFS transporter [Beijerinckia sp. L45]|uniref:MFS transporter n=1 Tax=Beijerinckia sp. L45 TaxID=1641855 RepID=UPI00131D2581|nr:MFS transporter [Beijerinckia sp. L45]
MDATPQEKTIETKVPARLDALKWGRFHTLIIVALGITWILDGLEVTFAGLISGALKKDLHFSDSDVGLGSSCYLAGAVVGALVFGWLTDRLGRRVLFFVTLGVYLVATAATAFSWDIWSFCLCRFFTGAGIGGEYSAVNSTIQEFIPAKYRGQTDLAINGSFWIGGAMGAAASIVLLNDAIVPLHYGWRSVFFIGSLLSIGIIFLRTLIPESPRWLVIHGREEQAEKVMTDIEGHMKEHGSEVPPASDLKPMKIHARTFTPLAVVFSTIFVKNRQRAVVGLLLMVAQAFFYNAIFFTFALVLEKYYNVEIKNVGLYLLPFALGNVLGPILLGPLFDKIGRKPMIAFTYAMSGVLLAVSGWLFAHGMLTATHQIVAWAIIFFFASSAAGAAYLTVSETFPVEIRALAIAVFYALGTGIGGIAAPFTFGALIQTGNRDYLFGGYLFAAALMIVAALVQAIWGVAAEGKSLEEISEPLSAAA